MDNQIFELNIAGHLLRYSFLFPGTRVFFGRSIRRTQSEACDIRTSYDRLEVGRKLIPDAISDAYVEYKCLIGPTARALLPYRCCIFHAVAFIWHGYAWLMTGPSGVGKTTQFRNWSQLFPGEITMISGDMPALECRRDGSLWVHPTPWNGKERMSGTSSAPLAGIVLLEQGERNTLYPLSPRDTIIPFFRQFIVHPDTEGQIHSLAEILDQMLRNVPVWKLINLGDDASTKLLRRAFSQRARELTGGSDGTL